MRFDGDHVVGNVGISQVWMHDWPDHRVYIEWTDSDVPQVTVVLADGTAVHSRHTS
jgi:hypothetical protein